jgi:hypothetical protein
MLSFYLRKQKIGMKKKKVKTEGQLKEICWKWFSKFIRQREADWRGYASCITCGVVKHWKELQAGHFIPGRRNAILFHEKGCHQQCYRCNVPLKGNPRAYDKFMRQKYGAKVIRDLEALNETPKKWKPEELLKLIEHYKKKVVE